MCINPKKIWYYAGPNLKPELVPCKRCWACKKNRVNDLTGRALCEAAESDYALALTLTYDSKKCYSPMQPKVIHKQDFQIFIRLWRRSHTKARYLVAGEYGARKGRAHFHAIIFGQGMPPSIPEQKNTHIPEWQYGHVYAEFAVNERNIRYATKYLVKSLDDKKDEERSEEWVSYSKKPLLGYQHIVQMAERNADAQLFPRNFNYRPPGSAQNNRYSFQGKAQEVYLDKLFELWPAGILAPKTEWMQNATRRYLKAKMRKIYDNLPTKERIALINDSMNINSAKLLTNARRYALSKKDQERAREWQSAATAQTDTTDTTGTTGNRFAPKLTWQERQHRDRLIANLIQKHLQPVPVLPPSAGNGSDA